MSDRAEPIEKTCRSCGKEWISHDGMIRTCAALQAAQKRIETLEALTISQAERIAAQSELLGKKAEKPSKRKASK